MQKRKTCPLSRSIILRCTWKIWHLLSFKACDMSVLVRIRLIQTSQTNKKISWVLLNSAPEFHKKSELPVKLGNELTEGESMY